MLSKMTRNLANFVYRLKNSNFILESKLAELNQNKNSKQPDTEGLIKNKGGGRIIWNFTK